MFTISSQNECNKTVLHKTLFNQMKNSVFTFVCLIEGFFTQKLTNDEQCYYKILLYLITYIVLLMLTLTVLVVHTLLKGAKTMLHSPPGLACPSRSWTVAVSVRPLRPSPSAVAPPSVCSPPSPRPSASPDGLPSSSSPPLVPAGSVTLQWTTKYYDGEVQKYVLQSFTEDGHAHCMTCIMKQ